MSDVTERKLFSAKQLWTLAVFVSTATGTVALGYFQLDAKASSALAGTKALSEEVRAIKCLIQQQNHYQFYKTVPGWECK